MPELAGVALDLRAATIPAQETNAFRIVHGASDGWPGWYVDRVGDFLLSQSATRLDSARMAALVLLAKRFSIFGAYHKTLERRPNQKAVEPASPQFATGERAPEPFFITENGLRFELSFQQGYSYGLFLDQRDNRRRLLMHHVCAGFPLYEESQTATGSSPPAVLNAFAYTCGFSVCAARAGARTTSLDLSKKYLAWGKRNFELNGISLDGHDFIYGDVFDWFRRLASKRRQFDVVLLDPPTFSQSREAPFSARKDYVRLIAAALPLVKPGGVLFASTNARDWAPEDFVAMAQKQIVAAGRSVLKSHYAPQPPDFPISRAEPGHLKTLWAQIG